MTQADFALMLEAQGGRCALCGSTDPRSPSGRFVVDHDHACCPSSKKTCGGCVRALLCDPCNRGIGLLKESADLLEKAAIYLRRYGKQPPLWTVATDGAASTNPVFLVT